jgi:hypothetical protein
MSAIIISLTHHSLSSSSGAGIPSSSSLTSIFIGASFFTRGGGW